MFFAAVDLTRRKSHERTKSLRVDLVQCSVGVFDLPLQVGSTFSRQTARCRSPFELQQDLSAFASTQDRSTVSLDAAQSRCRDPLTLVDRAKCSFNDCVFQGV